MLLSEDTCNIIETEAQYDREMKHSTPHTELICTCHHKPVHGRVACFQCTGAIARRLKQFSASLHKRLTLVACAEGRVRVPGAQAQMHDTVCFDGVVEQSYGGV